MSYQTIKLEKVMEHNHVPFLRRSSQKPKTKKKISNIEESGPLWIYGLSQNFIVKVLLSYCEKIEMTPLF